MKQPEYSVDDRGNVAQFYAGDEIVAELDREYGPKANQLAWRCDDAGVEKWAKANGYADSIAEAIKVD